jgi:hypothetical protein
MGEGGRPAPRRVQDLALNLSWFRVGVDKMRPFWSPLSFTLLDKVFNGPCCPINALSNGVNPLPPRGGEIFRSKLKKAGR